MTSRNPERILCISIFIVCLVVNLGFSAIGFHNSVFEIHGFRQVQTALTAQYFQQEGWSLAYPTPVFGPPWSVPMEFPLYQYAVAKVSSITGLQLESAGRAISLACLYGTLPACFGLMGLLGIAPARRWLLPALMLLSPVYLYYSRSVMIESTALCASAWFLLNYCRALAQPRYVIVGLALATGIIAALVKVTTLAVFLVPAAIYTLYLIRQRHVAGNRNMPTVKLALLMTLPAIAAAGLWVRYSDGIKRQNPLAEEFVSSNLKTFNFGTIAQRFTHGFWQRVFEHTSSGVLAPVNIILVVLFTLALGHTYRSRAALLLLSFLAGPLVFANLYYVHDYYFYANGVLLLGTLALGWCQILNVESFSTRGKWLVIVASLGIQLYAYFPDYYRAQRWEREEPPELGTILSTITEPGDVLLIFGQDWFGQIPYTARRRAVMIVNDKANSPGAIETVLSRIPAGKITAMIVSGELRKYPEYAARYVNRLSLHPLPLLYSEDTTVFIAKSRLAHARIELEKNPPQTLSLSDSESKGPPTIPRKRTLVARLKDKSLIAMMSPLPTQIIHPFDLVGTVTDGRAVFNAHAPTDIVFELPKNADRIDADFGVLEAAYTGNNETDGMEFRIEWVTPDGIHHPLSSTYLSPSKVPQDRGLKHVTVALPKAAKGRLWFQTLPGPQNSISCDWGYWAGITIK